MDPTQLMTRPCVVRHIERTGADDMGEPTTTVTTTDTVCELQQATTAEQRADGLVVVTGWAAFLPPDVDVSALDEIEADGLRFTVDGDPWTVRHPMTGAASHQQLRLRQVT